LALDDFERKVVFVSEQIFFRKYTENKIRIEEIIEFKINFQKMKKLQFSYNRYYLLLVVYENRPK
jgi:hypothetical protein